LDRPRRGACCKRRAPRPWRPSAPLARATRMNRTTPAIFVYAFGALALAACTPAAVDKSSVRATQTAPESTRVDVVRIPYDPSLPRYVVTVAPLVFGADGSPSGSGPETPGTQYGWGPWGWGILPSGPKAQAYNPPTVGATANMGEGIAGQLVTA